MKKKLRFFLKYFAFLGALLIIVCLIERIIAPSKPFYEEEKDSFDVLFFGTSVCYCAFDPKVIENYGISSYNLGRSQQALSWTYYQMKDSLEYQSPSVIVLEPYGITYKSSKMDDIDIRNANGSFDKMSYSLNALKGAYNNVSLSRLFEFVFPITRWHSDINSFENIFKESRRDEEKGFNRIKENKKNMAPPSEELLGDNEIEPLDENIEYWLDRIRLMALDTNTEFVVIRAPFPYSHDYMKQMNGMKQWCEENNVKSLDLVYHIDEMSIDCSKDSYDGVHLNENGSEKVSRYIGKYLFDDINK